MTEEHLRGIALTVSEQAQAGYLAGFSDFRHLAVVFRQALGMPPTAYRRQMRREAEGTVH